MLTTGCSGPLGLRVGLNPDTVRELKEDAAASCLIIEVTPLGGTRFIWWRDGSLKAGEVTINQCVDPRSLGR